MSVGFKTTDFHNMDEKNRYFSNWKQRRENRDNSVELCLRHISTDVSFFKILQKSLVISYFSTEQSFVGNPDSDSRYVMGVIISHEVASYIKNFTLFLVTNMHYWCADVLIVIHSLTDSITCPYVTITHQFPVSLVCMCDTQGFKDRQDRCVELCEVRVSLRVCLDKTANPQATRTQYPVSQILISCLSVARREKKKDV